jgi:hypothetical protein
MKYIYILTRFFCTCTCLACFQTNNKRGGAQQLSAVVDLAEKGLIIQHIPRGPLVEILSPGNKPIGRNLTIKYAR